MADEREVGSPIGQLLKLVASKNLAEAKAMQEETPEALCFPTDSNKIVFNDKEYGGDINEVISVAGKKGAVTLTKTDVGLGNVSNTSDANKPISTATQTALNAKANSTDVYRKTETYTKNEIDTKVSTSISAVYKPKGSKATIAEVIALTDAKVGDVWDVKAEFTLAGKKYPASTNVVCVTATSTSAHTDANWDALGGTVDLTPYAKTADMTAKLGSKVDKVSGKQLSTNDYTTAEKNKLAGIASGAQVNTVTSVAGKTGAVALAKADVGLNNVDNTSDAGKPISTATQSALNNKVDKVTGKGLSTNDYTTAEKTKLSRIPKYTFGAEGNPGQLLTVAPESNNIKLNFGGRDTATGTSNSYPYELPSATNVAAGVMTAADKKKVDTLNSINRYGLSVMDISPNSTPDIVREALRPIGAEEAVAPKAGDLVSDGTNDIASVLGVVISTTSSMIGYDMTLIAGVTVYNLRIAYVKSAKQWGCLQKNTIDLLALKNALSVS
jgi:hypothetical protein